METWGMVIFGIAWAILGVIVGASIEKDVPLIDLLERWQTLVTGLFAVFAAYLAYHSAMQKENSIQRREDRKSELDKKANRSTLAFLLSETITQIQTDFSNLSSFSLSSSPNHCDVTVGENIIEEFRNCIRTLPDPVAERISHLLEHTQVTRARIHNFYRDHSRHRLANRRLSAADYLADLTFLHTLANSLFDYSRSVSEIPSTIERSDLNRSANILTQNTGTPAYYQRLIDSYALSNR